MAELAVGLVCAQGSVTMPCAQCTPYQKHGWFRSLSMDLGLYLQLLVPEPAQVFPHSVIAAVGCCYF